MQHFKAIGLFKLELQSGNAQFWSKLANFFVPGDFENWRMTLKNNKAPFLYYAKFCASFQIHWWSQTWVTAWKRSSRVKIGNFFYPAWPWKLTYDLKNKTIGHLSYAASTFVRHFIANGEFKLELQSGNAPFGTKWTIFSAVWPWNLTDDLKELVCKFDRVEKIFLFLAFIYVFFLHNPSFAYCFPPKWNYYEIAFLH